MSQHRDTTISLRYPLRMSSGFELDMSADPASGDSSDVASAIKSCYSSFLGSCGNCDAQGSCICSSLSNGYSDFVLMDRERWGEEILLCPQNEPTIIAGFVLSAILALEAIRRTLIAIGRQKAFAARQQRRHAAYEPLWALWCGVVSMLGIICLAAIKVAAPSYVIGIDLLPSFVLAVRMFSFSAGVDIYLFHVVSVASRTQQASHGRQHLQDDARRRWRRVILKVSMFNTASSIPLIESIFATAGYSTSTGVQLALAVSYYGVEAVRLTFVAAVMFIDLRRLERSFAASVEAAKVAFTAAAGGASVAAQTSGGPARILPPSLQILQDEIDDVEAAEKDVRNSSRKLRYGSALGAVGWIVLFLCPLLWNKATYLICFQCIGHAAAYMKIADTLRRGLRSNIKNHIIQQI